MNQKVLETEGKRDREGKKILCYIFITKTLTHYISHITYFILKWFIKIETNRVTTVQGLEYFIVLTGYIATQSMHYFLHKFNYVTLIKSGES